MTTRVLLLERFRHPLTPLGKLVEWQSNAASSGSHVRRLLRHRTQDSAPVMTPSNTPHI